MNEPLDITDEARKLYAPLLDEMQVWFIINKDLTENQKFLEFSLRFGKQMLDQVCQHLGGPEGVSQGECTSVALILLKERTKKVEDAG